MNRRSTKSDRRIETGQDVDPTHYFLRKRERPFHLDCMLIPESWTSRLRSVEVENFEDWRDNDHRPVVVALDLSTWS